MNLNLPPYVTGDVKPRGRMRLRTAQASVDGRPLEALALFTRLKLANSFTCGGDHGSIQPLISWREVRLVLTATVRAGGKHIAIDPRGPRSPKRCESVPVASLLESLPLAELAP